MSASLDPLIMDLIQFVSRAPRPYEEVIDAWRTNCPRLTVWEDAIERGFIACGRDAERAMIVGATAAGMRLLRTAGRLPNA